MATSILTKMRSETLFERLAEVNVAAEIEGIRNVPLALAICTEIESRLPEISPDIDACTWGEEHPKSYIEALLKLAEDALDARNSYLAAA